MRSKRTAAYVACVSVLAACALLAYDAVHPFFPKPEAVLTWPLAGPVIKASVAGPTRYREVAARSGERSRAVLPASPVAKR